MITLIFESHSTTLDNEAQLAAGWNDVALSEEGELQAKELGKRRKGEHFDVIYCSDLQRSYRTAEIAFGNEFIIVQDPRLRECNYGDWNGDEKSRIEEAKPFRIDTPYPNGESWNWAVTRVIESLKEIQKEYPDQKVLIIGHRATQYGIENCINGISVRDIALAPWRYQLGWEYQL